MIGPDGDDVAHFRKTHLYYTDETWALEGDGFFGDHITGLGQTAMGICMDIKSVFSIPPLPLVECNVNLLARTY